MVEIGCRIKESNRRWKKEKGELSVWVAAMKDLLHRWRVRLISKTLISM